jgi:hypothetical protein
MNWICIFIFKTNIILVFPYPVAIIYCFYFLQLLCFRLWKDMWSSLKSRSWSRFLAFQHFIIILWIYNLLNRGGNRRNFVEAGRLPILARGRSIKNSMSYLMRIHLKFSFTCCYFFLHIGRLKGFRIKEFSVIVCLYGSQNHV